MGYGTSCVQWRSRLAALAQSTGRMVGENVHTLPLQRRWRGRSSTRGWRLAGSRKPSFVFPGGMGFTWKMLFRGENWRGCRGYGSAR